MHIGINTSWFQRKKADPSLYTEAAVAADELGYESLWVGHHVVIPIELSDSYPYSDSGSSPHSSDMYRLDPWVLFGFLAGITKNLRFGSGVFLLPLVNPFVAARAIATADILSRGRIICGIGVGWNPEEYDILGEEFVTRGRKIDESLDILLKLWGQDVSEHDGERYSFGPLCFEPKPIQRPRPPMIYGGHSPAAIRRASELDGVYLLAGNPMTSTTFDEVAPIVEAIRVRREALGRGAESFEVTVCAPSPMTVESIEALRDLGVTRVLFEVGQDPLGPTPVDIELTADGVRRNLERVASEIVEQVR